MAFFDQVKQQKWTIRLFFTRILAVVCSGLQWFAVVCGGLWWFSCISLVSLPIVPNAGGDLRRFAVICGGLWWFAVVCDGLRWFVV